jgi:putative membrane protein
MPAVLDAPGFLGTRATIRSDVTLLAVWVAALLLTIGWQLAVHKRYDAHRRMQTVAVSLMSVVILISMIPSFVTNIMPGIPQKLLEGSYGITTLHALFGTAVILFGVFVVLRGHNLVPRALRFNNYKLVMRTSYALFMLTTLVGTVLYIIVFVYGV